MNQTTTRWPTKKIGDIATVIPGFAFKSKDWCQNGIPVIKIKNILGDLTVETEKADCVPFSLMSGKLSKYVLEDGDILVAMTGATAGKVGRLRSKQMHLLNQRVAKLHPLAINPLFFWAVVSSDEYQRRFFNLADGAAQPNMSGSQIESLEVPYPPLPTQRKIAAILSAYDDLIENNLRRIKILEEMAQNLYREWFVNFRFPGHEKVKMVDSSLGKIPAGWEVKNVQDVIKRGKLGKLYDQKTASPEGLVPILDQGRSGIIGYHNDEPGVSASEEDPVVVFANHTCYQKIVQYPFSAIQNVIPFIPSANLTRNIYWLHWATKDLIEFNDYKGHWPEFMSKELSVPDRKTTERFGMHVEPLVRQSYKLEKTNITLRQTRDLLLPKLISGELDVSELDISIPEDVA